LFGKSQKSRQASKEPRFTSSFEIFFNGRRSTKMASKKSFLPVSDRGADSLASEQFCEVLFLCLEIVSTSSIGAWVRLLLAIFYDGQETKICGLLFSTEIVTH
jgi:hypothetical protein